MGVWHRVVRAEKLPKSRESPRTRLSLHRYRSRAVVQPLVTTLSLTVHAMDPYGTGLWPRWNRRMLLYLPCPTAWYVSFFSNVKCMFSSMLLWPLQNHTSPKVTPVMDAVAAPAVATTLKSPPAACAGRSAFHDPVALAVVVCTAGGAAPLSPPPLATSLTETASPGLAPSPCAHTAPRERRARARANRGREGAGWGAGGVPRGRCARARAHSGLPFFSKLGAHLCLCQSRRARVSGREGGSGVGVRVSRAGKHPRRGCCAPETHAGAAHTHTHTHC